MIEVGRKFAVFMDAGKMQQLFQQKLPDCQTGAFNITGVAIQHPRFKTYLNPASREKSFLTLVYHLSGINSVTYEQENLILYAKAYFKSRSLLEYKKAYDDASPQHKEAIIHFSEYGLLAWFFPNDPSLPWLRILFNDKFINSYFTRFLLPNRFGLPSVIKNADIYIINYRPELRCTCRFEVSTLFNGSGIFYSKTFFDDHGSEIYRRAAYLYQRSKLHCCRFAIAKPLGYDAAIHTLWMQGMAGRPLLQALSEGSDFCPLLVRLAANLADFHNADIDGLTVLSEASMFAEIRKKADKLSQAFPLFANRLDQLVMRLEHAMNSLTDVPLKLVHGDFHVKQLLLLDDNRIALFDYDELVLANPLFDIANFCVDLLNQDLPEQFTLSLSLCFFAEYQKKSGLELNQNHFQWHIRTQLLTRAYRAFIQQKPDLNKLIDRFLTLAEANFGSALPNR